MPEIQRRYPPGMEWLAPEHASVLDSPLTKAMRSIFSLLGGDDPTSQVMGLMTTELPGAERLTKAVKRVVEKAKPITAYHGSPHDFEQFSLSKIGTGEGAQAYGHGLYFAENPNVAGEYARKLTARGTTSEPEVLERYFQPGRVVDGYSGKDKVLAFHQGTSERGWAVTVQRVDEAGNLVDRPRTHATAPTFAAVRESLSPGRQGMYEVAINADPEQFLDWDKSIADQPEAIRKLLGYQPRPSQAEADAVFALAKERGVPPASLPEYKALERRLDQTAKLERDYPDGRAIYNDAAGSSEVTNPMLRQFARAPEQASEKLKAAGIPGIKYLDQGSRSAGEGSRNYVVFDDNLIEILKKYGILLPAAGVGASQTEAR
jgi:hypothetical protein